MSLVTSAAAQVFFRHEPATQQQRQTEKNVETAQGRGGALAVIAVSERGSMFDPGPFVYMEKIVVGPSCKGVIDLDASVKHNLYVIAKVLGRRVEDLVVIILDRPAVLAQARAWGMHLLGFS